MSESRDLTVIGISGKIGSGKTTLAAALVDAFGSRAVAVNFADALKAEVSSEFGVSLQRFYDQAEKNAPISATNCMTLGQALQTVGSEKRSQDRDYWVKRTAASLAMLRPNTVVVVGDVRFKNEAAWIKQVGGTLVRLCGDPARVNWNSTRDLQHISEVDLDDYDRFDFVFDTERDSTSRICKIVIDALEK